MQRSLRNLLLLSIIVLSVAVVSPNLPSRVLRLGQKYLLQRPLSTVSESTSTSTAMSTAHTNGSSSKLPTTQAEWKQALDALPSTPDNIPAFFFGHGSPMLAMSSLPSSSRFASRGSGDDIMDAHGATGPLATFLKDFGPTLLQKYKPRAIAVFSAHWETAGERVGGL
jgi:hypothetical protein